MNAVKQIFIVDDNAADVKLITDFLPLSLGGCHFAVAEDGAQAIEFVRGRGELSENNLPDVIILDLNLPRKSGTEVLTEIRGNPFFKEVPVIVLSGSDSAEDESNCLALGANRFITKPSNLEAFDRMFRVIEEFLKPGKV